MNSEVDGLTANADHVLGVWINQGFEDSEHNLPHLWQADWDFPDRDSYIDPSPKMVELRAKYQGHIAAVLKIADLVTRRIAARILSFETCMVCTFAPDSDAANVFKQNNLWKRADFDVRRPALIGMHISNRPDWSASIYCLAAPAVTGVSALVDAEGIDQWRDYLRFHLIEHYADVLPRAVAAEHSLFTARPCGVRKKRRTVPTRRRRYKRRLGPSGRPTLCASLLSARS